MHGYVNRYVFIFPSQRINMSIILVRINVHDSESINNQSATIMQVNRLNCHRQKHELVETARKMTGRWRQLPTTCAILRIANISTDDDGAV